jgi:hypothetical protein
MAGNAASISAVATPCPRACGSTATPATPPIGTAAPPKNCA